jgi:hypothetical protein
LRHKKDSDNSAYVGIRNSDNTVCNGTRITLIILCVEEQENLIKLCITEQEKTGKTEGPGDDDPNLKTGKGKKLRKMVPPPTLAKEDGSSKTPAKKKVAFKQQYNVIRAQRARQTNGIAIGNVGPYLRVNIDQNSSTGLNVPGFDIEGDQRQFRAKNFHDARGGRNVSTSFEPEGLSCLAWETPHSLSGRIEWEEPVVVVLCDQNFPPILPTNDGRCLAVIRVEDARLFELEKTLKEILPGIFDPHGRLPVGSAVLVGSLTHLGSHGLESYAGDLVRVVASVSAPPHEPQQSQEEAVLVPRDQPLPAKIPAAFEHK